jgi:hypothetical protein
MRHPTEVEVEYATKDLKLKVLVTSLKIVGL